MSLFIQLKTVLFIYRIMSSTDSESLTFANVKTPTTMPASEKTRIQNLKCPPPLKPSQANAQIRTLNQSIQAQQTQIDEARPGVVLLCAAAGQPRARRRAWRVTRAVELIPHHR